MAREVSAVSGGDGGVVVGRTELFRGEDGHGGVIVCVGWLRWALFEMTAMEVSVPA